MRWSTIHEKPEQLRGHWYIKLKSGRLLTFWDAMRDTESAHTALGRSFSRAFKLAEAGGDAWDLERVEDRLDRVEEHMAALRHHLEKLRGNQSTKERIAQLRNVEGRTPEEAATYLAKADALEKKMVGA